MSDPKQVRSIVGHTFKHTRQKIFLTPRKRERSCLKPLHLSKAPNTTMKATLLSNNSKTPFCKE